MLSRNGGVRFSATDARAEVERAAEHSDGLRAELARREGRVPVLRLPFPADEQPSQGFDTAVVLPLRDEASRKLVRNLLAGVDDALLLALPSLSEIEVDVDGDLRRLTATRDADGLCIITDGTEASRWRIASASGQIDPELLADRPIEERARPTWALTWAVPCDAPDEPRRPATVPVFHGPTPTDEPLGLPALLIATLPLDPTRRRLAPGALTDFLLDRAADAYADLVGAWPQKTPGLLRLVPGPIADGPVDAELRRRIVTLLAQAAILPAAAVASAVTPAVGEDEGEGEHEAAPEQKQTQTQTHTQTQTAHPELLVPRNALVLTPTSEALVAALEDVIPGLLPAGFERDQAALSTLGVRGIGLADVVEAVAGLDRPPARWSKLYTALDGVAADDPLAFDALSALPVPFADGRTVRGAAWHAPSDHRSGRRHPRLPDAAWAACHPPACARRRRRAAAGASRCAAGRAAGDAGRSVGAGGGGRRLRPGAARRRRRLNRSPSPKRCWLSCGPRVPAPASGSVWAGCCCPRADGGLTPAGELLVPDSALAGIVDPELYGFVDSAWVERWGSGVLHAAGVPDSFPLSAGYRCPARSRHARR